MIKAVVFDCDGTLLNPQTMAPYPGIVDLLQRLSESEFSLYIWTGRDTPSLNKFINQFSLAQFFMDQRSAGECAPKPHPDGLRQMLSEFQPSECLVIGDSWADMKGAKNFGGHGLGALWADGAQEEVLKEFGATIMAQRPGDCYELILTLGADKKV